MDRLLEELSKFDLIDLASGIGALQLCPENTDSLLRLEFLASAVGHLKPNSQSKPLLNPVDWKSLFELDAIAIPSLSHLDELGIFTQEIQFTGKCYIAFSGLAADTVFIVRHILSALNYAGPGRRVLHCQPEAVRLASGVLVIGDAVAKRAGLERGVESVDQSEEELFLPEPGRLTALKSAVQFTTAELTALLEDAGIKLADLSPMVLQAGKGNRPSLANYQSSATIRPILKIEHNWIVVNPSSLLDALRHTIIRLSILHDDQEELAFRYGALVFASARHCLERIGIQAIRGAPIEDRFRPFKQAIFRFDEDKILNLIVACDSFEGYDSAAIATSWENESLTSQIAVAIDSTQRQIIRPDSPIKDMLHLVVFQGIGRTSVVGFDKDQTSRSSPLLLMTAEELKVISLLENVDRITLWQFAQASEQVRTRCKVVGFEALDEFGMYRECSSSYYLTDEFVPGVIHVVPGHALKLRLDAQRRWDFHFVVSPGGNGLEFVALEHNEKTIPIYRSYPGKPNRPLKLVDRLPVPVWVEGEVSDSDGNDFITFLFVETIAYWIWQFSPALEPILKPFVGVAPTVKISVRLIPGQGWQSLMLGADSTLSAVSVLPATVRLTIGPAILSAIASADNAGERLLVAEVLRGLQRLRNDSFPNLTRLLEEEISEELVGLYAPLGRKKKLLAPMANSRPALISKNLPPFRRIQEFDEQQVRDSIGDFLVRTRKMAPGRFPDGDRVGILKSIVEFLYSELQKKVASISSERLLENLVSLNERIIYENEHRQLVLPTHVACFGSFDHQAERLREELPNAAAAGVASRFLIEYVTARPPHGNHPFSISAYDRMLAIAKEIVNLASIADGIHYKLDDRQCELLPSGRLGFKQSGYEIAVEGFLGVYSVGEIRRAEGSFGGRWATAEAEDSDDLFDRMDIACKEEFGYTCRELVAFLKGISDFGLGLLGEPKVMPWPEFVDAMADWLGKDPAWIEAVAIRFTLEPRADFLLPPEGFVFADVTPWRFNRDLSYIRRPLLIRQRGKLREVIWGVRFADQAGFYFFNLCSGGRLKAKSAVMRKFIGKLHNEAGDDFNQLVAEIYRKAGRFIVRDRVKKIGAKKIVRANGEELGDIDVLVADSSSRCLFAVEAKAFAGALTPAELSNELAELFGTPNKPGAAQRHLERTEWLKAHRREALINLGLDAQDYEAWKVIPLIVLERELISPFLASVTIEVISKFQLRDRLIKEQESTQ